MRGSGEGVERERIGPRLHSKPHQFNVRLRLYGGAWNRMRARQYMCAHPREDTGVQADASMHMLTARRRTSGGMHMSSRMPELKCSVEYTQ